MNINEAIAENIKTRRRFHRETQRDIGLYLGVPQNYVSRWETGSVDIPLDALVKLANHWNISLDVLTGRQCDYSQNIKHQVEGINIPS